MELEVKSIKKYYGDTEAIHDMSLKVQDGELLAFLGPSGCGKTTLLRIIAGLIPATEGQVLFGGKDVTNMAAQKRNAAMVFQNYALFPNMTVRENVEFGLKVRRYSRKECREKAMKILDCVQLTELSERKIQELSGGQRQRVALARALVTEPDILLFDEPLSNLDQKLRISMRKVIRDLQQEFKITSIYVTHDQEEAMSIADKIAVMDNGILQQLDTPQNLYFNPKNRFVSDFIGKANLFPITVQGEYAELLGKTISVPEEMRGSSSLCALLRPENLFFDKPGHNAEVVFREILGMITRYHVRDCAGQEFLIDVLNKSDAVQYKVGDHVSIIYDTKAIRLLDH